MTAISPWTRVIAIRDAGITDDALILRLKKANQVFELTAHQQNVLRDDAVSQGVIDAMLGMSTEVAALAPLPIAPWRDNRASKRG